MGDSRRSASLRRLTASASALPVAIGWVDFLDVDADVARRIDVLANDSFPAAALGTMCDKPVQVGVAVPAFFVPFQDNYHPLSLIGFHCYRSPLWPRSVPAR